MSGSVNAERKPRKKLQVPHTISTQAVTAPPTIPRDDIVEEFYEDPQANPHRDQSRTSEEGERQDERSDAETPPASPPTRPSATPQSKPSESPPTTTMAPPPNPGLAAPCQPDRGLSVAHLAALESMIMRAVGNAVNSAVRDSMADLEARITSLEHRASEGTTETRRFEAEAPPHLQQSFRDRGAIGASLGTTPPPSSQPESTNEPLTVTLHSPLEASERRHREASAALAGTTDPHNPWAALYSDARPTSRVAEPSRPETFDGFDPQHLRVFVGSINMYCRGLPHTFPNEILKVEFAIGFLRGAPQQWAHLGFTMPQRPPYLTSWKIFMDQLMAQWGMADIQQDVVRRICSV